MVKVYMEVTKDKYQLPIVLADSPMQLAKICGVKRNNVSNAISLWKKGKLINPRFVYCEIEEDIESNE